MQSDITAMMDKFFRFKVGDLVQEVVVVERVRGETAVNEYPLRVSKYEAVRTAVCVQSPLIIVERLLQQCHGGVQLHYKVSGFNNRQDGGPHLVMLTELELVPWADYVSTVKTVKPVLDPEK